ncbi:winged helix-turn-helix domain-containing protein [Rheinheimera lutimaris]|nr:winged helix-turn-helix domain-containing protein [Rheinheimera lutimaris]
MAIKPDSPLQVGEWQYLPEQDKLVQFGPDGKVIATADLDNLSQKVANYFIVHAGKLVTKDELLLDVWGIRDVSDGRVTRVIRVLRVALGDDTREPRYIETIPKRGYRFIAPVSAISPPVQPNNIAQPLIPATTDIKKTNRQSIVFGASVMALLVMLLSWLFWPADEVVSEDNTSSIPMWRYKPVTAMDGLEFYHNVSPDERYLVFSHASPEAENVTVLQLQDLHEHKRVQLTDPSYSSFGAVFSPAENKIAYHRMYSGGGCHIRLLEFSPQDLSVVSDTLLVECGKRTVSGRITWSPDGRYLVYPSMDDGQKQMVLQLLALDSRVPEQLTVPPSSSFGDFSARFSRRGDKLVFLRDAAGSAQIWLMNLSNRSTQLLTQVQDTYPGNVDWNLDDTAIIYPSGPTSIGRIDINTSSSGLLAYTDNYANEIQVTKSGKIVASVGSFSKMNIKKVANRIHNSSDYNQPVFSSNRNESFIEASPVAGGPSAVVSRRSGLPQVWLFYEDGRQEQVTFFQKNERFRNLSFSPDGTNLLVQLTNEIWLIRKEAEPLQVAGGQGTVVGVPSWSANGEQIFYAESNQGRWQVVAIPLNNLASSTVFSTEKELYLECREAEYVLWRDSNTKKFFVRHADDSVEELDIKLPDEQIMLKLELRKQGIYYSSLTSEMEYQLKYYDFVKRQSDVAVPTMQLGRFSISADERYAFILEYEFGDIDIQELEPGIDAL